MAGDSKKAWAWAWAAWMISSLRWAMVSASGLASNSSTLWASRSSSAIGGSQPRISGSSWSL